MTRKLNFLPTKSNLTLHEQLGAGTVGVVYRATSPDLDTPVAVKLLSPTVTGNKAITNRFEREIQIMERLNHPHIVRHYGGGQMDGRLFYAMQLLTHGNLKQYLQDFGPLPWPQTAAFGVQIASALQHAHNHGVIHRDLKPSNLFFDDRGDLVLGDFGIARDTYDSDITDQGMTVGTYSYMSPEQITADGRISGKADLYSLGCVLFEMLTGRVPFQGANFAQVWEQHLHAERPSVRASGADCPQWLDDLVQKLLAVDPEQRPFNARAVEGVLLQHLIDEFGDQSRELTRRLKSLPGNQLDRTEPRTWVVWVALGIAAAGVVIYRLAAE
jgi:serine/threonine protein kinase